MCNPRGLLRRLRTLQTGMNVIFYALLFITYNLCYADGLGSPRNTIGKAISVLILPEIHGNRLAASESNTHFQLPQNTVKTVK